MSLYRHAVTLLEVAEATDEEQTGHTWAVLPSEGDGLADSGQSFRAFLSATQADGDTSPTTDVKVETSADGDGWAEVASSTQLTADGSVYEQAAITALGPYVRARTVLGGGSAPSHTAKVVLVSNGPFRLVRVS